MKLTEFSLSVGGRNVNYTLAEPDGVLAADPVLLLTFCGFREHAMTHALYADATRVYIEAGHRALSYNIPFHGEREEPGRGKGIEGLRDALIAGEDYFKIFVADGIAAMDEAQRRGWAKPGRIHAFGISRGGYCAIRLTAADTRIAACAALAPVTDWSVLREWAGVADKPSVADLALDRFVKPLVGRLVYTVIGNHDDRVGTDRCLRFYHRLFEAEANASLKASRHELHVISDQPGHGLPEPCYADVPRWLLSRANEPVPSSVDSNMP
jgi:hypothetical protein